ncbi:hypothetical protein KC326_g183 [Hortaea werneckii]|nr:hypothetical protein KC326_g183 [Hortaea werneckii]
MSCRSSCSTSLAMLRSQNWRGRCVTTFVMVCHSEAGSDLDLLLEPAHSCSVSTILPRKLMKAGIDKVGTEPSPLSCMRYRAVALSIRDRGR